LNGEGGCRINSENEFGGKVRNKHKVSYPIIILIIVFLITEGDLMNTQAQEPKLSREQIIQESRQHFQEGERFYNQGDYSRADEEFKKAQGLLDGLIKNQPAETEKVDYIEFVKKALESAENGKSEEAITHYLKAIALSPNNANLHYNLAIEYLKTRQFAQGAEELNRVIQLNPKDSDAYYNLGVLYEDYLGDLKLAKFYYTQYLKFSPRAADADEVKKWLRQIDKKVK